MKKLFFLTIAALGVSLFAAAESLTAEQALARALNQGGPAKARALKPAALQLAYTSEASEFYVYDRADADGFLIASGDTRMRPVLGVADSGVFDTSNPALRAWLDFYKQELAQAKADDKDDETEGMNRFDNYARWQPIEPMLQTNWDQIAPYNSKTPVFNGKHAPTGCVATAMAQLIKHLGYYKGAGTNTYSNGAYTYNFDKWTPDFSKMPAKITANSPQEQIDEISELMLACGMAVNMGYSERSSGAGDPINGLKTFLGYDNASVTYPRTSFNTPQWESLIYDQLAQGRPLYYAGTGDGGHAFICDGYSSDGLFHFNWGWGGVGDGYFALSALNPQNQGTGSGEGGYNVGQYIGLFITPSDTNRPNADSYITHPVELVYLTELSLPASSGTKDSFTMTYGIYKCPVSQQPITFGPTLVLKSVDGSVDDILMAPDNFVNMRALGQGLNFSVDYSKTDVPPGEYDAYFVGVVVGYDGYCTAYHMRNDWSRSQNDHWRVKVDASGKRTYRLANADGNDISIVNMSANDLYANDAANVINVTFVNSGNQDWIERVKMQFVAENGKVTESTNSYPFVPSHGFLEFRYAAKLAAGKYTVKIVRPSYDNAPQLGDQALVIEVKAGTRPGDDKDDKDPIPSAATEVALWAGDGAPVRTLERTVIVPGQSITGTTALKGSYGPTFSYHLTIADYDNPGNVLEKLPIASNVSVTHGQWICGQEFSVTPTVGPGKYKMYFADDYNVCAGYPADLIIGIEADGMLFEVLGDNRLAYVGSKTMAVDLAIPASVNYADVDYVVTAIAANAESLNAALTSVSLPSTLTVIEKDAFKGCSALKTVKFQGNTVPFQSSVIPFYGVNSNLKFYVPDGAYADYRKVFHNEGKVYCELTAFDVPGELTVMAGHLKEFTPVTNTPHYDPSLVSAMTTDFQVLQVEYTADGRIMLRGVAPGTATLSVGCTKPAVAKTVKVNVIPQVAVKLNKSKLSLNIDETEQLTATLTPESDLPLTWVSSDPKVAQVDANGLVSALSVGSAIISVYVEGNEIPANCEVNVISAVTSIKIEPETISMTKGEWSRLKVVVTPQSAANAAIEWSSENSSVANIGKEGDLYAAGVGTTRVHAKLVDNPAISAYTTVTVSEKNGILEMEVDNGRVEIFDLQGRKVSDPSRGIYIVNGKKVFLK